MTSSFSASAPLAQHRARLGQMIVADVGDDDVHAGALQRLGDAETDPARAAGDERGLAFKILQWGLL